MELILLLKLMEHTITNKYLTGRVQNILRKEIERKKYWLVKTNIISYVLIKKIFGEIKIIGKMILLNLLMKNMKIMMKLLLATVQMEKGIINNTTKIN